MKISKLIEELEAFKEKYGDLDCYCAVDEEGNGFEEIYSITYLLRNKFGDIGVDEEDYDEVEKVCILN